MARAQQRIAFDALARCWLRNAIYGLVFVLALPWLVLRACSPKGLPVALFEKLTGSGPHLPGASATHPRLWLHGVSVGEIQLLAALVERLEQESWEPEIVLSTTTGSGMELANKLQAQRPKFYFPYDFSWAVARTLRRVQPDLIVLGELELWPNLVEIAHQWGVPIVVINGRLSENSFRGYQRLAWLTRGTFAKLAGVGAQTTTYAGRFQACGCGSERVCVTGNMKFDNVQFDAADERVSALRHLIGVTASDRLLVVGSTQEPEELAVARAFLDARQQFANLKLIVVPRHPDRFESVFQELGKLPVRTLRRSELAEPITAADWEILLVDTVGELKWWWGLAEIAIVGGSFGTRGGQNMLEPAAYGANVAFGPNTSNFKDVAALLLDAGGAVRLPSLEAIPEWLLKQLEHPEDGRTRGEAARQVIRQQQGATTKTITLLQQTMKQSRDARGS